MDIYKKNTEKGEFFFYKKPSRKIKSEDVLKTNIPDILKNLSWKKSMKWGTHELYWGRPLKSILAIFDNKPLKFEFNYQPYSFGELENYISYQVKEYEDDYRYGFDSQYSKFNNNRFNIW